VNLLTGVESTELFGGSVTPAVQHLIDAARFWLFTLKALAFISLRRDDRDTAAALVAQLKLLDPEDHLGASVVAKLLQESA
jgi:hypothetical protein